MLKASIDFDKDNEYIIITGVSIENKLLKEYIKNDLQATYNNKINGYKFKNYKAPKNVQPEIHLLKRLEFIESIENKSNKIEDMQELGFLEICIECAKGKTIDLVKYDVKVERLRLDPGVLRSQKKYEDQKYKRLKDTMYLLGTIGFLKHLPTNSNAKYLAKDTLKLLLENSNKSINELKILKENQDNDAFKELEKHLNRPTRPAKRKPMGSSRKKMSSFFKKKPTETN
jgi:hypothetical protein